MEIQDGHQFLRLASSMRCKQAHIFMQQPEFDSIGVKLKTGEFSINCCDRLDLDLAVKLIFNVAVSSDVITVSNALLYEVLWYCQNW